MAMNYGKPASTPQSQRATDNPARIGRAELILVVVGIAVSILPGFEATALCVAARLEQAVTVAGLDPYGRRADAKVPDTPRIWVL